jgi:hypothetical protein
MTDSLGPIEVPMYLFFGLIGSGRCPWRSVKADGPRTAPSGRTWSAICCPGRAAPPRGRPAALALAVAVCTCGRFTTPDKQFVAPGTAPGRLAGANDIEPVGVSNSYGRTEPGVASRGPARRRRDRRSSGPPSWPPTPAPTPTPSSASGSAACPPAPAAAGGKGRPRRGPLHPDHRKAHNARRQLEALGYDVIITLREDAA